jgi:hypothetical protein
MKTGLTVCFILSAVTLFAQPQKGVDYLAILKGAGAYDREQKNPIPVFTYQSSNYPALKALRKQYNLDSIAGFGTQESRLINLMHWVHNTVKHNGAVESGIKNINATEIIHIAAAKNIGVSCGELATTLNDCLLAMGWSSRKIYCFPKDSLKTDNDSHVINAVWLSSKNKWIWLDPTNDAYIMNEKGELLGIAEVRQRLVENRPLIVNPDANWNHKSSMTKDYYLDIYMAKNLYRMYSPLNSEYDYETWGRDKEVVYINLLPLDAGAMPKKPRDYFNENLKTNFINYYVFDPEVFWQKPGGE